MWVYTVCPDLFIQNLMIIAAICLIFRHDTDNILQEIGIGGGVRQKKR